MLELLFHLEYFFLTFNNCLKVIQLVIEQLNTKLSETLIPIFIIIKCSNIIILQSVNMVKIEHRGTLGCVKRNIIKTQISPLYYTLTQTYPPCYEQISPFPPPFSAVSYFLFVLSTVKKKDNCKI